MKNNQNLIQSSTPPTPPAADTADPVTLGRMTQLASKLLGVTEAWVLLAENRDASRMPGESLLKHSFGRLVITSGGPVIISDAHDDERTRADAALELPGRVAFLGVPLRADNGQDLGSFCLMDRRSRQWTTGEVGLLCELAKLAISEIELTARVRREQAAAARYEHWMHHTAQAAVGWGADGRINRWNPAAERIFGHRAEEAIGAFVPELIFAPEHQPAAREFFQRAAGHSFGQDQQLHGRTAAGRPVLCHWSLTPLRQPDGAFDGAVALVNDVTLQSHAQEQLEQLEAELRHTQKLSAIGHLVSTVAHDLNNIIAIIMAQSEFIKMGATSAAELQESAEAIHGAGERGRNLTRQLLMFTRKQPARWEKLELNQAVRNMSRLLARLVGDKIRMKLQLADAPLMIHADANMFDQVLMNLVVNARDAMPDGGELVIQAQDVEFNQPGRSPERSGSFACLTVRDSGCGIAPEILPRILDPFFTTKTAGQGSGLGLSIVQGIIKQHRGWIEFDSRPGQGTTARIFFPRNQCFSQSETAQLLAA